MLHMDYLLRNPINEVEKLEEIAFVGNVAHEVIKFGLTFIYNHYGPIISIRTDEYMKSLYQLPCGKREPNYKTVFNLILREFKKETDLVVASERVKWVGINKFYDYTIYAIELGDSEIFQWMKVDKNSL